MVAGSDSLNIPCLKTSLESDAPMTNSSGSSVSLSQGIDLAIKSVEGDERSMLADNGDINPACPKEARLA